MLAPMKLKRTAVFLCIMSVFCACGHNSDIPEPPTPARPPEVADRTVLAYVLGDNSLTSFATTDLNEMLDGIKDVNTSLNNLIVYIDRKGVAPQLIRICRNTDNQIIKDTIQSYSITRNSVGVSEMEEVFTYTFDNFPAKSYGLVLWSHGDGWIPAPPVTSSSRINTRWIGQDTNNGSADKRLNIDDLHTVLKSVPRLDYLLFDACYMQSVEVAYELRDCADYFIGSPTEIPGPGAPYQAVVPALFAATNPALSVAGAYYDFYEQKYNGGVGMSNANWTGGVSIAVLQSSKLDALASATRDLSIYSQPSINQSGILCYDPLREKIYFDMEGVVKTITGNTPAFQNWKAAYDAAVVYKKTTPKNYVTDFWGRGEMFSMTGYTGVSIYILGSGTASQDAYYKKLLWYRAMMN